MLRARVLSNDKIKINVEATGERNKGWRQWSVVQAYGLSNSKLDSGKGDDTIIAFGGRNKLKGGQGSDTFHLSGDGFTRVLDYNPEEDTVLLPDGYGLDYKNDKTRVFLFGEKIAKINGIHSFL